MTEPTVIKTNRQFAEQNEDFRFACKALNIKPTSRQASKWRMKKGSVWKARPKIFEKEKL